MKNSHEFCTHVSQIVILCLEYSVVGDRADIQTPVT